MKTKIIEKSSELFLTLGFKSVTMDDISSALGVSKKTLYAHFENKTALVTAVTSNMFVVISEGIDHICALGKNPIEELYDIKRFVMRVLKDEKASPQFQLKKYYPKIYEEVKKKQFSVMQSCIQDNLHRGIAMKLYRDTIDVSFIARIYFHGMIGIKDAELFPLVKFSMNTLMEHYLEYHLRGICTPEGIHILAQEIQTPIKK